MNRSQKCILLISMAVCSISAVSAAPVITTGMLTQRLNKVTIKNWSPKLHTQIASACVQTHNWKALNTVLESWLMRNYAQSAVSNESWQGMSGLQRWCETFARAPAVATELKPGTLTWLLTDRSLTRDFFKTLTPRDNLPQTLNFLQEVHTKRTLKFPTFNRLALAMAVVWDVPRSYQPHGQVKKTAVLKPTSTLMDRFDFWVETQERGMADYDLTKLDPAYLIFIIDAACPLDELRWAQTRIHFTRGRLGKVYSSIKYDMERYKNGEYVWPYETYSLKDIKRKGGICIDQAYYATIAGKASGIPTLYFSGSGRQGYHAWFGYMKSDDKWDMDCGRYAVQNYVKGTAVDPQTDLPISDHQLSFITERYHATPAYCDADAQARIAKIMYRRGQHGRALKTINSALELAPKHLGSWHLKTTMLESQQNNYAALKNHLEAMAKQFSDHVDIKTEARAKLADSARKAGDTETARLTEKKAISDTRRDRHDLSLDLYRKKMRDAIKRDAWKEAGETVREAVTKFKKEISEAYNLTAEFIRHCLNNGKFDEANRALRHFKSRTDYKKSTQMESLVEGLEDTIRAQSRGK
jgi:tetratricopeptide (TPR) repeat protein